MGFFSVIAAMIGCFPVTSLSGSGRCRSPQTQEEGEVVPEVPILISGFTAGQYFFMLSTDGVFSLQSFATMEHPVP